MYNIEYTGRFKKDYKLAVKRGRKGTLIRVIISLIANGTQLSATFKTHKLTGEY